MKDVIVPSAVDWQALQQPSEAEACWDLLIRTCAGTSMTKGRLGYKNQETGRDYLRVSVRAKPSFADLAFWSYWDTCSCFGQGTPLVGSDIQPCSSLRKGKGWLLLLHWGPRYWQRHEPCNVPGGDNPGAASSYLPKQGPSAPNHTLYKTFSPEKPNCYKRCASWYIWTLSLSYFLA